MRAEEIKNSLNVLTRWRFKDDLDYLPKVLQEGEEIIAFCIGSLERKIFKSDPSLGMLIATSSRLFFLSKQIFKVEFIEFNYPEIKAIKKENFIFKSSLTFELINKENFIVQQISPKKASFFIEEVQKIKLPSSLNEKKSQVL